MLNAFRYLLCSKLCQHNRRVPRQSITFFSRARWSALATTPMQPAPVDIYLFMITGQSAQLVCPGKKRENHSISRHSSIRDFFNKKILRIFPNRTLAQNNNSCLTWDCSVIRAPMKMKTAVGFVHTLIIMKYLVSSCALQISKFCVVL